MNRSVFVALTAAIALFGCRNTGNQPRTNKSATDNGGTPVTVVGCLVPGGAGSQAGAVGTSGNGATSGFTLVDVTTTSTPTSDTGSVPSTPRRSGSPTVDTGTPRSFNLVGDKKQNDLEKYQNSKIEVTGLILPSTESGAGIPDVGAASAPTGTPATDVQRLRVDKVRQLDKNCSGNPNPNPNPNPNR